MPRLKKQKRKQATANKPHDPTPSLPPATKHEIVLLLAIDLGTTSCTMAYTLISRSTDSTGKVVQKPLREIEIVKSYPDALQTSTVPTDLYYNKDGSVRLWGHLASEAWRMKWYDERFYVHNWKLGIRSSAESKRSSFDVLSDFFLEIHNYMFVGPDSYFREHFADELDDYVKEFVIAVPGGWSPEEHNLFGKMVTRHGIDSTRVFLVPESECVARSWIRQSLATPTQTLTHRHIGDGKFTTGMTELGAASTKELEKCQVKAGQILIVADVGGGTADFVAYLVISINPFQVDQISQSRSVFAGGEKHDETFMETLFQPRIQPEMEYLAKSSMSQIRSEAMFEFHEKIKNHLGSKAEEPLYAVRCDGLRESLEKGNETNRMIFTAEELRSCSSASFGLIEQVLEDLMVLASKYNTKTCILLAGGVGCGSRMFKSRVKQRFGSRATLFVAENSKELVARGAIDACTNAEFIRNIGSRYSHGLLTLKEYDYKMKRKFPNAETIKKGNDDRVYIYIIEWLIKKGDIVRNDDSFSPDTKQRREYLYDLGEDVKFEQTAIISEEEPADDESLWTEDHETNSLHSPAGEKLNVQVVSIPWELKSADFGLDALKIVKQRRNRHLRQLICSFRLHVSDTQSRYSIEFQLQNPSKTSLVPNAKMYPIEAATKSEFKTALMVQEYGIQEDIIPSDVPVNVDPVDFDRRRSTESPRSVSNSISSGTAIERGRSAGTNLSNLPTSALSSLSNTPNTRRISPASKTIPELTPKSTNHLKRPYGFEQDSHSEMNTGTPTRRSRREASPVRTPAQTSAKRQSLRQQEQPRVNYAYNFEELMDDDESGYEFNPLNEARNSATNLSTTLMSSNVANAQDTSSIYEEYLAVETPPSENSADLVPALLSEIASSKKLDKRKPTGIKRGWSLFSPGQSQSEGSFFART